MISLKHQDGWYVSENDQSKGLEMGKKKKCLKLKMRTNVKFVKQQITKEKQGVSKEMT